MPNLIGVVVRFVSSVKMVYSNGGLTDNSSTLNVSNNTPKNRSAIRLSTARRVSALVAVNTADVVFHWAPDPPTGGAITSRTLFPLALILTEVGIVANMLAAYAKLTRY